MHPKTPQNQYARNHRPLSDVLKVQQGTIFVVENITSVGKSQSIGKNSITGIAPEDKSKNTVPEQTSISQVQEKFRVWGKGIVEESLLSLS